MLAFWCVRVAWEVQFTRARDSHMQAQRALAAKDEEIKRLHMSLAECEAIRTIAGQRSGQLAELNSIVNALESAKATMAGEAAVAQKMTTELKHALQDRDAQLSNLERQLEVQKAREAALAGDLAAEELRRKKFEADAQVWLSSPARFCEPVNSLSFKDKLCLCAVIYVCRCWRV
jgi:chromosome segregation ATPase